MLILVSSSATVVKQVKLGARRQKQPFASLECSLPKVTAFSGFRENCTLVMAPHEMIGLACSYFAGRLAERRRYGEQEHQWLYIDAVCRVSAGVGNAAISKQAAPACIVNSIAGEWLPDILVAPAQFGLQESALSWHELSAGAAVFARDCVRLFTPHRITIARVEFVPAEQVLESLIDFGCALASAGRLPDLGIDARDQQEIARLAETARLTSSEQHILTTRLTELRVRSGSREVRLSQLCSLSDWPSKRENRERKFAELLGQLRGEL